MDPVIYQVCFGRCSSTTAVFFVNIYEGSSPLLTIFISELLPNSVRNFPGEWSNDTAADNPVGIFLAWCEHLRGLRMRMGECCIASEFPHLSCALLEENPLVLEPCKKKKKTLRVTSALGYARQMCAFSLSDVIRSFFAFSLYICVALTNGTHETKSE